MKAFERWYKIISHCHDNEVLDPLQYADMKRAWKAALEWVLQEAEKGGMINEFNQPLYLLLIQEELENED